MKAALLVALMGGLFGTASSKQMVYVYYGAEMPISVGSITVRSPITMTSMLVCEDGYQASYDSMGRMGEELERTPFHSKGFNEEQVKARSNRYRRDFPVPRKASAINVPKCAIAWPSGVSREFPSFSVDVTDAKFPYEVTRDVERVMSANAADYQDLQAMNALLKRGPQIPEGMRASNGVPPQQPTPFNQPAPVYVPPALPAMPSVPFPSGPGRTTTVCRTLSNGTIVCN